MIITLPQPYRQQEVWAFHSRDQQGLAEQVAPGQLRKNFMLEGQPVSLTIVLQGDRAKISADGPIAPSTLEDTARRLLGLTLDPAPFEKRLAGDPQLGPLLAQRPGLRIAQTATPFEALTWAVIGQQVNLNFALAMRRTYIQQAGCRHPSGSWCYPSAAEAARIDPDRLEKFSRAKAATLMRLATAVAAGELDLEVENPAEALLAVKGVGPWTVNYTLLRGYARADCSLHGDSAVRKALGAAFGRNLTQEEAEHLLDRYRPYRSLAAAHFWASLSKQA